jgi:hypothetical protein
MYVCIPVIVCVHVQAADPTHPARPDSALARCSTAPPALAGRCWARPLSPSSFLSFSLFLSLFLSHAISLSLSLSLSLSSLSSLSLSLSLSLLSDKRVPCSGGSSERCVLVYVCVCVRLYACVCWVGGSCECERAVWFSVADSQSLLDRMLCLFQLAQVGSGDWCVH